MSMCRNTRNRQSGVGLIEVLIAIIVFAVGLLAIAQFQGSLVKSSSNAKARTVATHLAEDVIEQMRAFQSLNADEDPAEDRFSGIGSNPDGENVTLSGVEFHRSWVVEDYYYDRDNPAAGASTTVPSPEPAYPDFKLVRVTVDWEDEAAETQNVVIEDIIGAAPPADGGRTVDADTDRERPEVRYRPGSAPEIISVDLGGGVVKETRTPEPDVETDVSTVTRFETITYSSDTTNGFPTQFRREEQVGVTCSCTQKGMPGEGDELGLSPAVWTGTDWSPGEPVAKPTGETADDDQAFICDRCCRDHHDDVENDVQFDPFRPDGKDDNGNPFYLDNGDHSHFNLEGGELVPANQSDDTYLEACRMIRLEGRFRVARDFLQVDFQAMPEFYLQSEDGVSNLQDYIAQFVEEYVTSLPAAYPQELPDPDDFSDEFQALKDDLPTSAPPPSTLGSSALQLIGRSIYIDYIDPTVQNAIECAQGRGSNCGELGLGETTLLQVVPFYEINTTRLAVWSAWDPKEGEDEDGNVVPVPDEGNPSESIDVTSEGINARNEETYSRGRMTEKLDCGAEECPDAFVVASMQTSNTGIAVNSNPIDEDDARVLTDNLFIDIDAEPPERGVIVRGAFSQHNSVKGVSLSSIDITGSSELFCAKSVEPTGYSCELDEGFSEGLLVISNYNQAQDRNGNTLNYMLCPLPGDAITNGELTIENIEVNDDGTGNENTVYSITVNDGETPVTDFDFPVEVVNSENQCSI